MRSLVLFLVCATLAALAIGWATGVPRDPPTTVTAASRHRPAGPVGQPNDITLAALDRLDLELAPTVSPVSEAAGSDPIPTPDPQFPAEAPPPPLPPPPPPDVAEVFRGQVSAVLRQGPGLAVLLIQPPEAGGGSRYLRPGEIFQGDWRLTGLSSSEAVLQNGKETRRVSFYGASAQGVG